MDLNARSVAGGRWENQSNAQGLRSKNPFFQKFLLLFSHRVTRIENRKSRTFFNQMRKFALLRGTSFLEILIMTSEAQILANRRNAQKSTGPRTSEGKAAVSQNAVKHGLLARQDVISSESQAEFDLYRQRMLDELDPLSPMESMLAERIVTLSWRLKRVCRIQNQTIDALNAAHTSSPLTKLTQSLFFKNQDQSQAALSTSASHLTLGRLAIKDFANARVLDRLLMYERRIEHSLYRTILELQRLHLIRKLNTGSEMPFRQLTI